MSRPIKSSRFGEVHYREYISNSDISIKEQKSPGKPEEEENLALKASYSLVMSCLAPRMYDVDFTPDDLKKWVGGLSNVVEAGCMDALRLSRKPFDNKDRNRDHGLSGRAKDFCKWFCDACKGHQWIGNKDID